VHAAVVQPVEALQLVGVQLAALEPARRLLELARAAPALPVAARAAAAVVVVAARRGGGARRGARLLGGGGLEPRGRDDGGAPLEAVDGLLELGNVLLGGSRGWGYSGGAALEAMSELERWRANPAPAFRGRIRAEPSPCPAAHGPGPQRRTSARSHVAEPWSRSFHFTRYSTPPPPPPPPPPPASSPSSSSPPPPPALAALAAAAMEESRLEKEPFLMPSAGAPRGGSSPVAGRSARTRSTWHWFAGGCGFGWWVGNIREGSLRPRATAAFFWDCLRCPAPSSAPRSTPARPRPPRACSHAGCTPCFSPSSTNGAGVAPLSSSSAAIAANAAAAASRSPWNFRRRVRM
jgi:hypothetical protein